MTRWQAKLEKKQAVLGRIVDIGAELYAISAAAVYALAQQVLEGRHTWLEEGIADPSGDGPISAGQPPEVSRTG
jgi:hypothetical protein